MNQVTILHDRNAPGDDGYHTLEALIINAVKKELGVKRVSLGNYAGKRWEGRDLYFTKAKADGCAISVYCELDQYAFEVDCWKPEYLLQILID